MVKYDLKVSIIIPHWNGIETLSECIDSILETEFQSYEIIVSDNASTDGSQDWVKKTHSEIVLVENDKNYGYAGGCNRGASVAKGEFIIFLNNDTIQDVEWIKHLINIIETNETIAAVQPKVLNYYNKEIFDYAGGSGGYMDLFCYPFTRGRIFSKQEKDYGQYNDSKQCFWASGTAFIIRKDLFFRAGKFDEVFFSHMEEIDLCWRLHAMGFQIWVAPKSIVYHKNALSMPMNSHKKYYLNHRNSLIMLFGNYSFLNSVFIGLVRIILDFVAFGYSIFKLDLNHAFAIIRSLLWVFFHPYTILQKRYKFRLIRKEKDKNLLNVFFKSSIVYNYFVKNKNIYSDIESMDF